MSQNLSFQNSGATPVKNPLTWGPLGAVASAVKAVGSVFTPPKTSSVQGGSKSVGVLAPQQPASKGLMPDYNSSNTIGQNITKAITGTPQASSTPRVGVSSPQVLGNNPGMINQPIKAVTGVDGKKTEYLPPTPQASYDAKTGFVTEYGKSIGAKAVQPGDPLKPKIETPATPSTPQTPATPPPVNREITNPELPNTDTTNTSNPALLERLSSAGIGGQESPQVQKARQDLMDAQKQFAHQTSDINQSGTWTSRALGQQGQANIQNASVLSSLQQGVSNALSSQGQQIGATTSALGATNPLEQFGMKINPQTGQLIGGEGSVARQLIESALPKALQLYNSGNMTKEQAIEASGLGVFGSAVANFAMSSSLMSGGGDYNPTARNTQVGANMSNLDSTSKQAYGINQNLNQVKTIEPLLLDSLKKDGINPFEAQAYNGPVQEYLTQIQNPAAMSNWSAKMNELKNFTSQLLGSGYLGTPTGNEAMTISQDPSKLSYKALQSYLQTISALGNNRLGVLNQDIIRLGGTAQGNPGQSITSLPASPSATGSGEFGTGVTSPTGQMTAGLGLKFIPAIGNAALGAVQGAGVGIGAKLLNFIIK